MTTTARRTTLRIRYPLACLSMAGFLVQCTARIELPNGPGSPNNPNNPGNPNNPNNPNPNNPNNPVDPVNPNIMPPKPPPVDPNSIAMLVRDTTGVAHNGEIVRSGVPVPRANNWLSTDDLTVVDPDDNVVPSTFKVLARWNAGKDDTSAPIQWLLPAFPADLAAGESKYYQIRNGQAALQPATPLTVQSSSNEVTVNTGAAEFVIGPHALFDSIKLPSGDEIAGGGSLTAATEGNGYTHDGTRAVRVVHQDALTAIVVVEGTYDMPTRAGGGLSSKRRYEFRAGSATALIRHSVVWEGDHCTGGVLTCNGNINGILMDNIRDGLAVNVGGDSVMAVGDFAQPAVTGNGEASVRQRLRDNRHEQRSFQVNVAGTPSSGEAATGGMLAISGSRGAIGVALARMHRYEPQALRVLSDGNISIDIADDQMWLGPRQGMFAQLAVSAFAQTPNRADLDEKLWAPLNRPLRAWSTPEHFNASQAVDEFPVGELPSSLAAYDDLVRGSLVNTLAAVDEKGTNGIMTFGLYPRYWASNLYEDELDCTDPTPSMGFDESYWCGSWTDYHNTIATAPIWAMRSGEVEWLDEIAVPGALRMLHTQVLNCAPGDDHFYCGQSPAGYGGYRANHNSSHAYFDNLFLYYWISGDETVVETLTRGADNMRGYLCPPRLNGTVCPATEPAHDEWAWVTGRSGSQWASTFRFIGLAGEAEYLDDWRSSIGRGVTQHYVEANRNGLPYGFWLHSAEAVDGPGTDWTDQIWMASLYDMNNLYRYMIETEDAPVGEPGIRTSRIQANWTRSLVDLAGTEGADGVWPNNLEFTWSGNRLGGDLGVVTAPLDPDGNGSPCDYGDECLWETGKSSLTGVMVRGGAFSSEPAMTDLGRALTERTLSVVASEQPVFGKIHGLYFARLHAAVARLK